jgi:DNA gyrase subunit A
MIVSKGDDVLLAASNGMAIRFAETDARPMGRSAAGVKGITLSGGAELIGMVVADPNHSLLTVCENGYGKRTPFGAGGDGEAAGEEPPADESEGFPSGESDAFNSGESPETEEETESPDDEESVSSSMQYRRQRRGGKGLRDIKTTARNGKAVKILSVSNDDEVLMVTAQGKIQRIRVADISEIGRNTQGVRVIRLDEGDKLVSIARIPGEIAGETSPTAAEAEE